MTKKLNADDRHAIDLLLERPDASQMAGTGFARPAKQNFQATLSRIENILSTLQAMPASEPSHDLVSRTMQRIEEAALSPTMKNMPKQTRARSGIRPA